MKESKPMKTKWEKLVNKRRKQLEEQHQALQPQENLDQIGEKPPLTITFKALGLSYTPKRKPPERK